MRATAVVLLMCIRDASTSAVPISLRLLRVIPALLVEPLRELLLKLEWLHGPAQHSHSCRTVAREMSITRRVVDLDDLELLRLFRGLRVDEECR